MSRSSSPAKLDHAVQLAEWQESAEGKMVLSAEHRRVSAQLARATVLMRSDVLFQLRPWFVRSNLDAKEALQLHTAESWQAGQWPLPPEPVDLLLLPHEFELSEQPRELLRWANTVLDDKGWLIITGFKPPGFFAHILGGGMGKSWTQQNVSSSMVRLWLQEAGYKVFERESWSYQDSADPQVTGLAKFLPGWLRPKRYGYLVAARKTDLPGTPLRSSWKPLTNPLPVPGQAAAPKLSDGAQLRRGVKS